MPAMKQSLAQATRSPKALRLREQASARAALLVLAVFLFGLASGAYWYHHATKSAPAQPSAEKTIVLSDITKAVLRRLTSPVEIRFYSLLDPASVSDSLPAFAGRVDQLLSAYQQEASGRIKVTRFNSPSDANAQAAAADGVKPFNRDKGNVCYLGVTVVQSQQKESLPQLAPEWEAAVESDITRAIVRVMGAQPASSLVAVAQPDSATIEEVKRAVPNLASVSVEEGTRILREAVLKDFAAAADEMDLRLKEAEQRVTDAQGKSEAEQQAARKNLQQVQLGQAEKLKQVAARLQAQITTLQQLKKE